MSDDSQQGKGASVHAPGSADDTTGRGGVGGGGLKDDIRAYWEKETCGTRYADDSDRIAYFRRISEARYALEPYIPPFADFPSAEGKRVLEIGVGAGADFENWCRYADHATGVDLTERAISLTTERLKLIKAPEDRYTLQRADAESLPFPDSSFDLVYSWGVLLCAPDLPKALKEVRRVLRPGGRFKAMLYHVPSWTGALLYLQHGLLKGRPFRSQRDVLYQHLESPGTQAFSLSQGHELLKQAGFAEVKLQTMLNPGDLMLIEPSHKYRSPMMRSVFKTVRALYPRRVIRMIGDRYGLNLMIDAVK